MIVFYINAAHISAQVKQTARIDMLGMLASQLITFCILNITTVYWYYYYYDYSYFKFEEMVWVKLW